jgi:phospholipid/cholesterol/gamma-HCH transport system ATP-binding protein
MAIVEVNPLQQPAGTPPGRSPQVAPVLRFSQVTVRFDDQPGLVDVSFQVYAGETMVVSGAAGSGKTVLLKTAIGLIRPEAGDVYLFGQNITGLREDQLLGLRRRVGVLFQEGALFDSLTVEENVAYPLLNQRDKIPRESEVQARVKEALNFVALDHVLEKYPSELSGGMRRRVGIARAVVTKPPLMLYDSPTAGLDPITAYQIIALVVKQRDTRNTTSLVVTYRRQDGRLLANFSYDPRTDKLTRSDDAWRSTKFVVLRGGRLVFEGSEAELQSSADAYVTRFATGKRPPRVTR